MSDANHKAFIEERIQEARRIWKAGVEDQEFRDRAMLALVCPECGERLVRRNRFLEVFTNTARYLCTGCGARHSRYYGD